ncbi:ABC transporter substrate-binding protein [soil metagenome]
MAAVLSGCTPATTVVAGSEVAVAVTAGFTSANASTSFGRSSVTNADVAYLTGTGFGYYDDSYALVQDASFGSATVVADDPLTVRYTVSDDAKWSDGASVDAADLLLAWAANSGALNTPKFDDAPFIDPATGRYTDAFPADVVFFDGAVGGGLERATATPVVSDDGRSLDVHYESYFSGWRTALAPGVPAHVVATEALDLPAASTPTEADDAVIEAITSGDETDLGAIARFWNDAYNFTEVPGDAALLVSAGPYTVTDLVDNESITLTANPAYRGSREPNFETIVLRVSPDPLETVGLLAAHEVDIASPQPSKDVIAALRSVDGVSVSAGSEGTFEHLDLQFAGSRSLDVADPLVRRAFMDVVPRQQILDELVTPLQEDAALLESFTLRPGADGYADAIAENGSTDYAETDVAGARALLAEAGQSAPSVCILYDPANPRRVAEFQLIQTSAARAGFVVSDCSNGDWQGLLGVAGTYDAALYAWDTTRLGPAAVSAVFRSDSELANFSHYGSPLVDALIDQLDATDAPVEQTGLLAEIDKQIWQDAYGLPLFAFPTVTAVSQRVTGVTRSPLSRGVFWNAWEWAPAAASASPTP